MFVYRNNQPTHTQVSVLFSEPKIPQLGVQPHQRQIETMRFSALQRAENSSIVGGITVNAAPGSFSALQRAENSSMKT